jgi:hypothetical protein
MKKPCNAETVNALYQSGRHVPDVLIPLIPRHTSLARIFVASTSADQASASRPIHERPMLRVLTLIHSHSSTFCPRHVRPPSCLHRKLLQLSRQSLPPNIRRRLWPVSKTSACSDRGWPVGQLPRGHGDGNRVANSGPSRKSPWLRHLRPDTDICVFARTCWCETPSMVERKTPSSSESGTIWTWNILCILWD